MDTDLTQSIHQLLQADDDSSGSDIDLEELKRHGYKSRIPDLDDSDDSDFAFDQPKQPAAYSKTSKASTAPSKKAPTKVTRSSVISSQAEREAKDRRIEELVRSSSSSNSSDDEQFAKKRRDFDDSDEELEFLNAKQKAMVKKEREAQFQTNDEDFYKLYDTGRKGYQPKQGKNQQNEGRLSKEQYSQMSVVGRDIDRVLEKYNADLVRENEEPVVEAKPILEIVQKNEKQNEAIPDKVLQAANQLLSFDSKFYSLRNKLMLFTEYSALSKKMNDPQSKYYGLVKSVLYLRHILFVGTHSGIIRVFDMLQQREMKPLMDEHVTGVVAVTSLDNSPAGDLLLSSYGNGAIAVWDLVNYRILKYVGGLHESSITNAKLYFATENWSNIQILTAEERGGVRRIELTKKPIFGGYNCNQEFLFRSKLVGTTALQFYKPNPQYPHAFCDTSIVAAIGGMNVMTICTLNKVDCINTIPKPSFCSETAVPYVAWGTGLSPSFREKTVPLLAMAWDKVIQLMFFLDDGTMELDGFYFSDRKVIGLQFIGESILLVLFSEVKNLRVRETKILYTTKFYPGGFHILENYQEDDPMKGEYERFTQVTKHAELELSQDLIEVYSQTMGIGGERNFTNSMTRQGQDIMILGAKELQRAHLFSWREYIEHLQTEGNNDWISVLKVALEIYNGDLKGYANVPDEKEIREAKLREPLQDLVQTIISSRILKSKRGQQVDSEDTGIKVAIEFCLSINSAPFLFGPILKLFEQQGLRKRFIQNLEQFIMSGQFRNEFIPEQILKEFLHCYQAKGGGVLEQRNLERIVQQLDLKLYSVDMVAELDIMCEEQCMVNALLSLRNPKGSKQQSMVKTMFELMTKINQREKKEEAKAGKRPYAKSDVQQLFDIDSKRKYEVEKSSAYMGYKLLWIIKMYLMGRQVPYGSLSQERWESYTQEIAQLIISSAITEANFLREFLLFDSQVFLEVIEALFHGDQFNYIAYMPGVNQDVSYPSLVLRQIRRVVERVAEEKKAELSKEMEIQMSAGQRGEDDIDLADYNTSADCQATPMILFHYSLFYLRVLCNHKAYLKKVEEEKANPSRHRKIQNNYMGASKAELSFEYISIIECLNRVLEQWAKMGKGPFDQELIIDSIKHCPDFSEIDAQKILTQLDQLNLQTHLVLLRIFLLEKRGEFTQSFRLHMTEPQLAPQVFDWIQTKFSALAEKLDKKKQLEQLKKLVADNMREIIGIDVQKTIELIGKWYDDQYSHELILGELSEYPDIQFTFLQKYIHFNEDDIKLSAKEAAHYDGYRDNKKYAQLLSLFVTLMCQLIDGVQVTGTLIEAYVKKEYFPIQECLQICQDYHQYRAVGALLERDGQTLRAMETYMMALASQNYVEIGREILLIIRDQQTKEGRGKGLSYQEISRRQQEASVDDLIKAYGSQWGFEECYKYEHLSAFDQVCQKACELAKFAWKDHGEKAWFDLLHMMDEQSKNVKAIFHRDFNNPDKLTNLFKDKLGQDIKAMTALVYDFILRRKNHIVMHKVPMEVSPKELVEKLNLDLVSIRKIFDFKIKNIKDEKHLFKIANQMIVKEVMLESEAVREHASRGYPLEPDPEAETQQWIRRWNMMASQKDTCDMCDQDLLSKHLVKAPVKVFLGCGHVLHNHCANAYLRQAKERNADAIELAKCPKCASENQEICFEETRDIRNSRQVQGRAPRRDAIREKPEQETGSLLSQSYMDMSSDYSGTYSDSLFSHKLEQFDSQLAETQTNFNSYFF